MENWNLKTSLKNFSQKNLAGIILIVFLVCIFLYKIFLGYTVFPGDMIYQWPPWSYASNAILNQVLPVHNPLLGDPVTAFYPWRHFMGEAFRGGFFPLWNPYILAGTPLFANWQSGVLDPLNFFFYIASPGVALNLSIFFKLVLAGSFMFIFLRQSKISLRGSLLGSIIYTFSAFYVSWLNWPHTSAAVWLPLILLFTERLITKGSYADSLGLGISFAFLFFAGHPGTLVQTFLVFTVYAIVRLFQIRPRPIIKRVGLLFFGTAIGLLLAAVLIIPGLSFMNQTYQFEARSSGSYIQGGLPLSSILLLIFPFVFGNLKDGLWIGGKYNFIEMSSYLGIVTPYLVFLVFSFKKYLKKYLAFFIVSGYSLILVFSLFVHRFLYRIPIFTGQPPQRFIFSLTFAFAFLAAIGFDLFFSEEKVGRRLTIGLVIINLFTFALLFRLVKLVPSASKILSFYSWHFVFLALVLIIFLARFIKKIPNSVLQIVLVGFLIVDLFVFGINQNTYVKEEFIFPPTGITNFLKSDQSLFRILPLANIMSPNTPMVYGLQDIRGRDALLIKRFKDFSELITDRQVPPQLPNFVLPNKIESKLIDFLNIKYVINRGDIAISLPTMVSADHFIEVRAGVSQRQSFIAANGNLSQVDFLVGTHGKIIDIPVIFRLYVKESGRWLEARRARTNTAGFRDNTFASFIFEPIKDSKGKTYLFSLETPTATQEKRIALYAKSVSFIKEGKRYEGSRPLTGSIAIMPRYKGKTKRYQLVYKENDLYVYKNTRVLPRAYFADRYKVIKSDQRIFSELRDNFNPQVVILEKKPVFKGKIKEVLSPVSTTIKKYSPNEIEVGVKNPKLGLLVLSDTYFSGWNAYVDGEQTPILRANYSFRAVPLNEGNHQIIFRYEPLSFNFGIFVSLFTLAFVIGSFSNWFSKKLAEGEWREKRP